MKYPNLLEEEIKIKVRDDFFTDFDSKIIGKIDFCITPKSINQNQKSIFDDAISLLWAEAKTGDYDIVSMFAQLILTIGKTKDFKNQLPPAFLGAFDSKKIVFIPYNTVMDIFTMNDFNWNVTSSNPKTKEFLLIKERIEKTLQKDKYVYDFLQDEKELRFFIKNNITKATESGKIIITKNNFVPIYLRWIELVKPSIDFDWEAGKKQNIFDSNFFLADLFVDDKNTAQIDDDTPINENLFVVFKNGEYQIAKENLKLLFDASIKIKDKNQYEQFWKKYKRPPVEEIQNHIINRKDLLVAQDIRERKGAFFTPRIWVELSQEYLAKTLGENWQQDYYVWDCAAGTGNLLIGLTETRNLFASTLDQSDVNVMHDLIEKNQLNLFENHVFQFDFLNDEFLPQSQGGKLPDALYNIITNENERKKLVIYINPPYAEAASKETLSGINSNKTDISVKTKVYSKYFINFGISGRELFAQFFMRIYKEIDGCIIAEFSKLKIIQSPSFKDFREIFKAKLKKLFVVPADTFDNVNGKFPIGFFIWNTSIKDSYVEITSDVFNEIGNFTGNKIFTTYDNNKTINDWLIDTRNRINDKNIAFMSCKGSDFQTISLNFIINDKKFLPHARGTWITNNNLIESSIYYSVRHCIEATWLNDRDQFLYPNNGWENDKEFQNNCLAYTLFNNNIQSQYGTNHWIPFTEQEVGAKSRFESNFMTQFIAGKIKQETKNEDLFSLTNAVEKQSAIENQKPLQFSEEAKAVFDAGRKLYTYYHTQPNVNVNASLYDIKEYFQGRNDKGRMNPNSKDETYTKLLNTLKENLKILAKKIEPKVYEYGFLKE